MTRQPYNIYNIYIKWRHSGEEICRRRRGGGLHWRRGGVQELDRGRIDRELHRRLATESFTGDAVAKSFSDGENPFRHKTRGPPRSVVLLHTVLELEQKII